MYSSVITSLHSWDFSLTCPRFTTFPRASLSGTRQKKKDVKDSLRLTHLTHIKVPSPSPPTQRLRMKLRKRSWSEWPDNGESSSDMEVIKIPQELEIILILLPSCCGQNINALLNVVMVWWSPPTLLHLSNIAKEEGRNTFCYNFLIELWI